MCGDQHCLKCGELRDLSPQGMKWNLSVEDNGSPGGQGPCGDSHEWGCFESCGDCESCCYGQA